MAFSVRCDFYDAWKIVHRLEFDKKLKNVTQCSHSHISQSQWQSCGVIIDLDLLNYLNHVTQSFSNHNWPEFVFKIWFISLKIIKFSNKRRSFDELQIPHDYMTGYRVNIPEMVARRHTAFFGCTPGENILYDCPACRTYLIATRFWVVVICPIIKCLTVLEFSFILFDLCLFITIFNFILNYVPIVTFWIFTYHKIWILLIIFCFIWNYWIIYFLTCLEVFWSVVS